MIRIGVWIVVIMTRKADLKLTLLSDADDVDVDADAKTDAEDDVVADKLWIAFVFNPDVDDDDDNDDVDAKLSDAEADADIIDANGHPDGKFNGADLSVGEFGTVATFGLIHFNMKQTLFLPIILSKVTSVKEGASIVKYVDICWPIKLASRTPRIRTKPTRAERKYWEFND